MKYAKPEVAVIGSALKTIQSQREQKGYVVMEFPNRRGRPSAGAYEADE